LAQFLTNSSSLGIPTHHDRSFRSTVTDFEPDLGIRARFPQSNPMGFFNFNAGTAAVPPAPASWRGRHNAQPGDAEQPD